MVSIVRSYDEGTYDGGLYDFGSNYPPAPKVFLYHLYTDNLGSFFRIWADAASIPEYNWNINSGISSLECILPRQWGMAGEKDEILEGGLLDNLVLGHRIDIYAVDKEAPEGILIYRGNIEEYTISDPPQQPIRVTLMPLTSRFEDRFIYGPLNFVDTDPTDMVQYLVDNDYLPGITFDASNPLVGQLFTISFEKEKVGNIMERIRQMAGNKWYWRLNPDSSLTFNKWDFKQASDHRITSEMFSVVNYIRSRVDVKKRVYVFGAESRDEFGALVERIEAVASVTGYDPNIEPRDLFHTDSRITDNATALRAATSLLQFYQEETIETEVTIFDNNHEQTKGYDIESLKPGQTLEIFNPRQIYKRTLWGSFKWLGDKWGNQYAGLVQGPLVISSVEYKGWYCNVKLTNRPVLVVEELVRLLERQNLEGST